MIKANKRAVLNVKYEHLFIYEGRRRRMKAGPQLRGQLRKKFGCQCFGLGPMCVEYNPDNGKKS